MMNLTWKIVKHTDLSIDDLHSIAVLKNQHWPYGIDSQIRWTKENVFDEDFHLMGMNEDYRLVAYITISRLSVVIDGVSNEVLGIGGVCIDKEFEHHGYGKKMVNEANSFIQCQSLMGLLLCKENLVAFYKKCGWLDIEFECALVAGNAFSHKIMAFPNMFMCKSIAIDRNF